MKFLAREKKDFLFKKSKIVKTCKIYTRFQNYQAFLSAYLRILKNTEKLQYFGADPTFICKKLCIKQNSDKIMEETTFID